jgi:hypothetical protein
MTETKFYESPALKEFFKFYVTHQWVEQEYIKRYIEQNFQLQNFCKLHNIDYYVFNAFYAQPSKSPNQWKDLSIVENLNNWSNLKGSQGDPFYNWKDITRMLKSQWALVDEERFVNKDLPSGSFRSYIHNNVPAKVRMCNWHPSPESHKAWANYLFKYITRGIS